MESGQIKTKKDNDMDKTYFIEYEVIVKTVSGPISIPGRILVKRQVNELFAKLNLGKYLKRKYGEAFNSLYIKSIREYTLDFFSFFRAGFGK